MANSRNRVRIPVDTSLLSEADVARINKEAEKNIQDERKKAASSEYLDQQTELERAKYDTKHELVELIIDLPAYTKNMLIDGVYYNHGDTVSVPKHMADSIRDNMARAWLVERQAGNPNLRDYIPVRESTVSALSTGRV